MQSREVKRHKENQKKEEKEEKKKVEKETPKKELKKRMAEVTEIIKRFHHNCSLM